MKQLTLFLVIIVLANYSFALPVTKVEEKKEEKSESVEETSEDVESNLEYERYLKEVVGALESDPDFRQKLDNATEVDVRSGKIAHELEYVNHHVRTKLDEIKRREIERLRLLAIKQYELTNDIDRDHLKIDEHEHIDHENEHTFEIEDLKKLILKTSKDLAEADEQRRKEFKEYELQKEFEKQEKIRELDEEHRKQYEEDLKKQQALHNDHEKVHHPGSKAQLEEVWEKKDHMDKADFNPVTFFMTHDLDNNGQLDETELKAIFTNDLDKVYQPGHSEDDMREREEEMERMREHVMREVDTNGDRMVSMEELLAQTKREEFQKDPGWETVDQQPQFTHEEYMEFERRRQAEIQQLIAQGRLPPHANMPNGYYPNEQGPYQAPHPNQIPQQGGYQQRPHYQQPNYQHQQQQQQQYQYQQQQQQQYQQQQYQQQVYHNNQQQQQRPVQYQVPQQGYPVPPNVQPVQAQPNVPQQAYPVPPNQQPIQGQPQVPQQAYPAPPNQQPIQGQPQISPSNQQTVDAPPQAPVQQQPSQQVQPSSSQSGQVPPNVQIPQQQPQPGDAPQNVQIPQQQVPGQGPQQVQPEPSQKKSASGPAANSINADPSAKQ